MVRTSPSNARGVSSIPGQGAKSPHASGPNPPTSNSIKILKMFYIKQQQHQQQRMVQIKKSFKENRLKTKEQSLRDLWDYKKDHIFV